MEWKEKDAKVMLGVWVSIILGVITIILLSAMYCLLFKNEITDYYYVDKRSYSNDNFCLYRQIKWRDDNKVFCSYNINEVIDKYKELQQTITINKEPEVNLNTGIMFSVDMTELFDIFKEGDK